MVVVGGGTCFFAGSADYESRAVSNHVLSFVPLAAATEQNAFINQSNVGNTNATCIDMAQG